MQNSTHTNAVHALTEVVKLRDWVKICTLFIIMASSFQFSIVLTLDNAGWHLGFVGAF